MSRPDEPFHAPDRPSESRLWKGIGLVALLIVVGMALWWVLALGGDAAQRDLDEPETEPLEPAQVEPPPPMVVPERESVVRAT